MTYQDELAIYLAFIKKAAHYKIWDSQMRDDVVQDVFIKLHNKNFFQNNALVDGQVPKTTGAYIITTIERHRTDIYRKYHKIESVTDSIESENEFEKHFDAERTSLSNVDHLWFVREEAEIAYVSIKECFQGAITQVKDSLKKNFFEAAFWRLSDYGLPLKELANHIGFINSNPTQDFNRFLAKVSICTQNSGITLVKPNEQIDILLDLISSGEE